jgi:hypothetical protein
MARTAITPVAVTRAGSASMAPVAADVANGNSMANNARLMIGVTNSDAAIHNFSITPTRADGGGHVTAVSTPIAASTASPVWFGPYSVADYGSTLQINGDNAGIHFQGYTI